MHIANASMWLYVRKQAWMVLLSVKCIFTNTCIHNNEIISIQLCVFQLLHVFTNASIHYDTIISIMYMYHSFPVFGRGIAFLII